MTVHTVPALFAALVDDAGLFPPERLPMPAAVARHRADAEAGHPVLTHRFLCPASRLSELRAQLETGEQFRLGLIVDTAIDDLPAALDHVADDSRLKLETVELGLPQADDPTAAVDRVTAATGDYAGNAKLHVELPLSTPDWAAAVPELANRGLGAKVRCGGIVADLFPTVDQVAAFLAAVATARVPFKATAGLHHAVRYRDPSTGFTHHGFLNLLVAVCRAVDRSGEEAIRAALWEDDAETLAGAAHAVGDTTAASARSLFLAYGSCSTSEPVDDLTALALLEVTRP
jgi:hypothetical protein